ncbi:SurA N-terminal domain-containing protein [Nonomuraea dietziae]|uniref:Peptidyl-prolyl cis-trans isomerase SurA n=1 Tax=Nonomuraea dietziae TaxID=65515 RepID=A0A7W5YA48_9ACTN|nr:SurA N-terminal domain-containing protein [Nonomuraea dietziae]MBB3730443.1 peptidyl-prolyl cis-trans isomerase SurA [Nonomuraea dietziae]
MKSIRMAVAVAALGVAVSACSSPVQAGSAAVVGNERISASDLNTNVKQLESALAKAQIPQSQLGLPVTQYALLQMVNVVQFRQLASKAGAKVTDGEIDQLIASQGGLAALEKQTLAQGVPPAYTREWLGTSIAINKMMQQYGGGTDEAARQRGQQKLIEQAAAIKVTYSPRYGTFDPQKGFVDAGRFGKPTSAAQG